MAGRLAVIRGLVLACAAAVVMSGAVSDGARPPQDAQPRISLLAGQGQNSAEAAGGLPRTAWKDISAFQQLRTAEGHALEPPVTGLS